MENGGEVRIPINEGTAFDADAESHNLQEIVITTILVGWCVCVLWALLRGT